MEMLNEYLKTLLSSCSDELRLEPDKRPFMVSDNRTTDVGNVPLKGTQISTMVFPLIPADAKSALPNKPEIEFVHPHNLGNFSFTVQKSSSGFIVTIRPALNGSSAPTAAPLPETAPSIPTEPVANTAPVTAAEPFVPESVPEPAQEYVPAAESLEQTPYEFESSSLGHDTTSNTAATSTLSELFEEDRSAAQEYVPTTDDEAELEVVPVNDPEFQTVFSDTSTYEPPGRRDDFEMGDYVTSAPEVSSFDQTILMPTPSFQPPPPAPVVQATPAFEPPPAPVVEATASYEQTEPTPMVPPAAPAPPVAEPPAQAAFVPAPANNAEKAKMDVLFTKMAELGASDLHLSVTMPPMVRKDGRIKPLEEGAAPLSARPQSGRIRASQRQRFRLRNYWFCAFSMQYFHGPQRNGSGLSHHPFKDDNSVADRPFRRDPQPMQSLQRSCGRHRADGFG